jgi:hypothetical protein
MRQDEMIAILERYKGELEGILARFRETPEGIYIDPNDDARYRTMALELRDLFVDEFVDGRRQSQLLGSHFAQSISNYVGSPSFSGVEGVKGVVTSALVRVQRNPLALKIAASAAKGRGGKDPDVLTMLAARLDLVVRRLRDRRESRPTLNVTDEYDVQDLFHALLTIHFDDIRPEEWAPSYAGAASRMDFFLPEIETIVEIKMTRPTMSRKQLGEQVIVDIEKYKKHPGCRSLFCVVYDPAGRISNPRGFENDLARNDDQIRARVMIVPR